jgi:hypothetical protein
MEAMAAQGRVLGEQRGVPPDDFGARAPFAAASFEDRGTRARG